MPGPKQVLHELSQYSQTAYLLSKNPSKQGHSGKVLVLNVERMLHLVHYEGIVSQVAHLFSHFLQILSA